MAAKAIDESLTKLDLAYIDLVLLHQPYGDTFGAWRVLANAQADGRIKLIGISNFDSAQMIEFTRMNDMKITPQANQIEINPWNQRQADVTWLGMRSTEFKLRCGYHSSKVVTSCSPTLF